jgi:AAA family ATP:ADP antiporter
MSDGSRTNRLTRIVRAATKVEANELSATLLSFVFVFVLMTAYSILKPVRDALGADWGAVGLSVAWSANFVLSVIAVSAYGAALSIFRFRVVVPGVYAFFALTFLFLYLITTNVAEPVLINKGFYVWVSVFSLFHLSVFWSFMSDLFDKSQAPRLFGFIAAGASFGAIVGPLLTALLVDVIGTDALMLVSATLLLVPVPIILVLEKLRVTALGNEDVRADLSRHKAIGKNPFAGFSIFVTSKYLLTIGAFILLYVTISTFVYFELQDLTSEYGINTRAKIWSWIDLATNVLTLLTAAFVTSRIVTRLGMPVALSLMPGLIAVGVLALVAAPTLVALAIFQVMRRVGNYAITRPSREMLYTIVDRETRFKAKPVIDIVVYRGGDMVTAWMFTFLAKGLGLGLAGIAFVISGIAVTWAAIAIYLGHLYGRNAAGLNRSVSLEGEIDDAT